MPVPTAKVIAVNVPVAAHFGLTRASSITDTAMPRNTGERSPVVAARGPRPRVAASVKQATRRTHQGATDGCPSVFVRKMAPRAAKMSSGWWNARAPTNGAMAKIDALTPVERLKADLSKRVMLLKNAFVFEFTSLSAADSGRTT